MPTLILKGHNERYACSELMRLFFGDPVREIDGRIRAGQEGPLIESHLSETHSQSMVLVTTKIVKDPFFQPGSLHRMTATVKRNQAGREIRRQLYQILSAQTGYRYPWGSLTGICPTKIAIECLRQEQTDENACRVLRDEWFVSPEKADLAVVTAHAEQAVLESISPDHFMVYIGIPFCPTRCSYCSFITHDAKNDAALFDDYVNAVVWETQDVFEKIKKPVSAVYFGGGTPTVLSASQLDRLLFGVLSKLSLICDAELTVEAGRPDTMDKEKLSVMQRAGINRLCINPQTFHDETLQRIGRRHTTEQTIKAFELSRKAGFDDINMDLIYGLPEETPEDFQDSLRKALTLKPDSLTLHALAQKRSSELYERIQKTQQTHLFLPEPLWFAMLNEARLTLESQGLTPYYLYRQKRAIGGLENTGFARSGKACRYNVGMMSDSRSVVGIGSGSISKRIRGTRVDRFPNPRNPIVYLERVETLADSKAAFFNAP